MFAALRASKWWEPYFAHFGAGPALASDTRRRARLLILACHGTFVLALMSAVLRVSFGQSPPLSFWGPMLVTLIGMAAGPLVLKRTGCPMRASILPIGGTAMVAPLVAFGAGGLDAPVVAMLPAVPLVAAFFMGSRAAVVLTVILTLEVGLVAVALQLGWASAGQPVPPAAKAVLLVSFTAFIGFLSLAYDYERRAVEAELRVMADQLYETSIRDPLTNAANRRYFAQRLERELAYSKRHRTPVSVLVLDADHFKAINDTFGHAAGDVALVDLARLLATEVREEDLVARYGGEEFVILLRDTPIAGAVAAAERVRKAVESHRFEQGGNRFRLTVSIGCASVTGGVSADELLQAADRRLYDAKLAGRNRVVPGSAQAPEASGTRLRQSFVEPEEGLTRESGD